MDILRTLGHGVTAGAAAGSFAYLLAEPVMDRAVRLESARVREQETRARAAGQIVEHHADVFSRQTQHLGLLGAALGTGIALGVIMAVPFALLHRRDERSRRWHNSLRLGASAFFGIYLVPFLRYPPNPPGVGDPGTLDQRTHAYLIAIAIGLIGAIATNRVRIDLSYRGVSDPQRQLAVTAVLAATVALTFLLPANSDALDVPAGLLWQFRLLTLATSVLLWGTLSVEFGLLINRQAQLTAATGNCPEAATKVARWRP